MITRQTVRWLVFALLLMCSLVHRAAAQEASPFLAPAPDQETGPVIDVWYGPYQAFGTIGLPIPMINILGRVAAPSGIAGLYYALNGSAEQPLSIGPDGLRLVDPGDFNVEIDLPDLLDGFNTLVIRAVDHQGNESITQVILSYDNGSVWPQDYAIDWSTVMAVQDVAQVLDGRWELSAAGVRPLQTGYDRLIAMGDRTWENYEATTSITILGINPQAYEPMNKGAAVGLLLRWPGHADWNGERPRVGWWPHGAIGLLRWTGTEAGLVTSIQMFGDQKPPWVLQDKPREVVLGATYVYKMRAQTMHAPDGEVIGSRYRLKIWEQDESEPTNWDLTVTEGTDDPQFGSLVLLSHFVDCVFGNVTVVPLPSQ
jgi:hypothetical protein